jgi:hypothetical protein
MTNNLEEKLLLMRAKRYANDLDGVDVFSISLLKDKDFLWHRQELREANNLCRKIERVIYTKPGDVDGFIKNIMTLLNISNQFSCYLFYEGRVCISICGNDFYRFSMKIIKLNRTYDLSLVFISPDRILSVSDNEYDLDIYYKCSEQA